MIFLLHVKYQFMLQAYVFMMAVYHFLFDRFVAYFIMKLTSVYPQEWLFPCILNIRFRWVIHIIFIYIRRTKEIEFSDLCVWKSDFYFFLGSLYSRYFFLDSVDWIRFYVCWRGVSRLCVRAVSHIYILKIIYCNRLSIQMESCVPQKFMLRLVFLGFHGHIRCVRVH